MTYTALVSNQGSKVLLMKFVEIANLLRNISNKATQSRVIGAVRGGGHSQLWGQ